MNWQINALLQILCSTPMQLLKMLWITILHNQPRKNLKRKQKKKENKEKKKKGADPKENLTKAQSNCA